MSASNLSAFFCRLSFDSLAFDCDCTIVASSTLFDTADSGAGPDADGAGTAAGASSGDGADGELRGLDDELRGAGRDSSTGRGRAVGAATADDAGADAGSDIESDEDAGAGRCGADSAATAAATAVDSAAGPPTSNCPVTTLGFGGGRGSVADFDIASDCPCATWLVVSSTPPGASSPDSDCASALFDTVVAVLIVLLTLT